MKYTHVGDIKRCNVNEDKEIKVYYGLLKENKSVNYQDCSKELHF